MKTGIPSGLKSARRIRHTDAAARSWSSVSRHLLTAVLSLLVTVSAAGSWQWEEVGKSAGPGPRTYAVVIWTGSELLVWGGLPFGINTDWRNDGWRYVPGTNSWHPMSSTNAPGVRQFPLGVWTGHELVIWGGHKVTNPPDSLQTGACYDPATDTWHPTSLVGAPPKRGDHTMIWTGSEVIVWGGYNFSSGDYLRSGGRYNPASNSWTAVSVLNAPGKRSKHTAIWNGSEMIIWGGGFLTGSLDWEHRSDFGCYDPADDQWNPGPTAGAPASRSDHSALWTGTGMIVWGGWNGNTFEEHLLQTGALLDRAAGTWTNLPLPGAPAGRAGHCAAWTGREMIVWGGSVDGSKQSGARFEPSSGTWSAITTDRAPTGGNRGAAAWTGEAFYLLYDRLARACESGPYRLDGIPDDWQYQYFGAQNSAGAADQDPDADGQNNAMEFLARTSPVDPQSRLGFAIAWLPATRELEFSLVPGWPDRKYRLEQSTLSSPIVWQTVGENWTDQGSQPWTMRLPLPDDHKRFYRLAVGLK